MASTTAPLDAEELYDALSNDRRRACVRTLDTDTGWIRVKALANTIAGETAADPEGAVESTYISLIQIHLPKLETYGVVSYDEDEKVVAPGPTYDQAVTCLEEHAEPGHSTSDVPLHPVVFGVSTLGLVLALVVSTLSPLLLGVVIVLQLVGLAVSMDWAVPDLLLERTRKWTG